MHSLSIMASIIMIIMMILLTVLNLTSKKTLMDREKSSPFECGFDPKSSSRLPFSMHFFLIAIIFLIFDVEITLLLPMIISLKFNNTIMYSVTLSFFIVILMVGLVHEWKQGALTWTN